MHNCVNDSLVVIHMVFVCLFATSHFLILFLLFPLAATRCNMATRSAKMGTAKSVFGCNGKSATKWAVPWNIATETMAATASLKNLYTRGLQSWSHTTAFRSGGEKTCPLYRGKGRVKSFAPGFLQRNLGSLADIV